MPWFQKTISLRARSRGCYLITSELRSALPELSNYRIGLLTLSLQHTSCALSLNENYDELVRADMRDALERLVPEVVEGGYRHCDEGSDDMPVCLVLSCLVFAWVGGGEGGANMAAGQAHVKSALIGVTVTVPITDGELAMGTWQGSFCLYIYLSICVLLGVGTDCGVGCQGCGIWSSGGRAIRGRSWLLFMGS